MKENKTTKNTLLEVIKKLQDANIEIEILRECLENNTDKERMEEAAKKIKETIAFLYEQE